MGMCLMVNAVLYDCATLYVHSTDVINWVHEGLLPPPAATGKNVPLLCHLQMLFFLSMIKK